MKPTTIIIQFVCVALAALFMFVGLLGSGQVLVGGLLLGSVMFLFAAILGADHTTNPNPTSRLAFKVFTVIVALPILAIAAFGCRLLAAGTVARRYYNGRSTNCLACLRSGNCISRPS
ncbi:MAG: hypothetical protein IPN64_10960 [Propionivibrio sp.]|nr:hypothetical protein [Propionivibrio sp.]